MKTKHFLAQVDHDRLHRAIQSAERGTSARMVVYITHRAVKDPLAKAHAIFRRLGMEKKGHHGGFLIFLSPKSQKFAVLGGTGLHEKLGQKWWDEIASLLAREFKEARYMEGLLAATAMAGEEFHRHFASAGAADDSPDVIED